MKGAIANIKIKTTTTITLDTTLATGGIHNIPFVVRQADTTAMRAIFWMEELEVHPGASPNTIIAFCSVAVESSLHRADSRALMAAIEYYRARAVKAGGDVERVVAIYEAGCSGFWLDVFPSE